MKKYYVQYDPETGAVNACLSSVVLIGNTYINMPPECDNQVEMDEHPFLKGIQFAFYIEGEFYKSRLDRIAPDMNKKISVDPSKIRVMDLEARAEKLNALVQEDDVVMEVK